MNSEDTLKTIQHLINKNDALSAKNGELRAAINIILLKPELIEDEKIKNELQEIANDF